MRLNCWRQECWPAPSGRWFCGHSRAASPRSPRKEPASPPPPPPRHGGGGIGSWVRRRCCCCSRRRRACRRCCASRRDVCRPRRSRPRLRLLLPLAGLCLTIVAALLLNTASHHDAVPREFLLASAATVLLGLLTVAARRGAPALGSCVALRGGLLLAVAMPDLPSPLLLVAAAAALEFALVVVPSLSGPLAVSVPRFRAPRRWRKPS